MNPVLMIATLSLLVCALTAMALALAAMAGRERPKPPAMPADPFVEVETEARR